MTGERSPEECSCCLDENILLNESVNWQALHIDMTAVITKIRSLAACIWTENIVIESQSHSNIKAEFNDKLYPSFR